MEPEFWHQRWQEGRIGFHQDRVTPLLERHWSSLVLAPGSRVFVPLAGKSLDLAWLASQGHRVFGVELSRLAVEQFFIEHDLQPTVRETRLGTHFSAGAIELVCGDVFDFDRAALADCNGVFDRAALIALPPELRRRYADEVYAQLPGDCRGLLVTIEYPPGEKQGPPFSVDGDEVQALFGSRWRIGLLERRDILDKEPRFAAEGVTRLHAAAWRLDRES